MILRLFTICIIILFYDVATAQYLLKGHIKNEDNQSISSASILISSSEHYTKKLSSDDNGLFSIDIPKGIYQVKISYVGLVDHTFDKLRVDKSLNLGTIILHRTHQHIDAVSIVGQRKLIEQKSDRTIINIENSLLVEGLNGLEILQRASGVNVDEDNIQLRGKSGVGIMINGKLSYLSAKELTTLLKGTASSDIKSIELITNPSSKYDAAGMAGLINIVMKPQRQTGFNTSINAFGGKGRKERYGGGISMNYRQNKWNFLATYNGNYRGEEEYRGFVRKIQTLNNSTDGKSSNQYSATNEPLQTNNLKFGIDYDINENAYVGVRYSLNKGTYNNYSIGYNNIILKPNTLLTNALTNNTEESHWNTNNISIDFLKKSNDGKHEIATVFDYLNASFGADQLLIADYQKTDYQNPFISKRRATTPSETELYVGKLDYTYQISPNSRFEIGWKSSLVNADNNSLNDTLEMNNWVKDFSTSNHFIFDETIHAGYTNYSLDNGNWKLTGGLRLEYTNNKGHQLVTDSVTTKKYAQLFPSISTAYKFDEYSNIQISYSRRIERPSYEDLNPFRHYIDAFLFWEGNALLQPELANSYELNYTNRNLLVSLFFTQVNDKITSVLKQIPETNTTIRSLHNIEHFTNMGFNINCSYKPYTFWSMMNNAILFHNHFDGSYNNEKIDNKQWTYTLMTTQSFKMKNNWSFEILGEYNAPKTDGVIRQKSHGQVSSAVMKSFLENRLSFKLAMNDIFKTKNYRASSLVNNVAMTQNFNNDNRTVILSATFKIGKDFIKLPKKHQELEETKRIRSGN